MPVYCMPPLILIGAAVPVPQDRERLALPERKRAAMRSGAKDMHTRLKHRHPFPAPIAASCPVSTRISITLKARDPIRPDDELRIIIDTAIIAARLPHGIEIVAANRHNRDPILVHPVSFQYATNLLFLQLGRLHLPLSCRLLISKSLANSNAL